MLILLLSACGGGTPEEKIYNHLEEAVAKEADFEERQNQLIELEKQEQKIYGEIIEMGKDDMDEIKTASKKAIGIIEDRAEEMKAEQESIKSSQDEFEKTDKLIDKLEDEQAKKKGREMYDVMMERYQTYEQLHKAYTESLNLEEALYTILQKDEEKVDQEEVTKHIDKINKSYEKVLKENKKFNEKTTDYNKLKKEFYDAAGIDVDYDAGTDKDNENNDSEDEK
jgi:chromosome segregation ATPase